MKKLLLMVGILVLGTGIAGAQADDHAHDHDGAAHMEGEAGVDAAADVEAMVPDAAPVRAMLADGTELVIEGDAAFVVDSEGGRTPAPDGTHTLSDGTALTTSGGMVVETPPADASIEAEVDADVDADADMSAE